MYGYSCNGQVKLSQLQTLISWSLPNIYFIKHNTFILLVVQIIYLQTELNSIVNDKQILWVLLALSV